MFTRLEEVLLGSIDKIPLELYVAIASFVEEVVAPIPSSAVLLSTGSFAAVQNYTLLELIPLVIIAAAAKSIGALLVYSISGRVGSVMVERYGRFFGVTTASIANLKQHVTGTPRDYVLLTILRALPIIPSAVLSIGCGILQIPLRLFFVSTVIGTIVRDALIIYVGFKGTAVLYQMAGGADQIESIIQSLVLLTLIAICSYGTVRYVRQRLQKKNSSS